jgi:hypothetical protein
VTQEEGATIVVNSQEGHIQITMVASRQDSNAEVTSAEVTSTESPLRTHSGFKLVRKISSNHPTLNMEGVRF